MTDDPSGCDTWACDPATYLKQRPARFALPARPFSVYLAMHDGVRLAVDVHVPQGRPEGTSFPTIVVFTPYYRRFAVHEGAPADTEVSPNVGRYRDFFVPRGYALVAVDVRGTGASFGTRDSFRSPRERGDYARVIDWIVEQPWCDGHIGSTGISYVGAAADFAASSEHGALKAIAPISAVWDTYADHYYPGGMLLSNLATAYNELMIALDHDRRDLLQHYVYFSNPNLAGPAPVDEDSDGALAHAAVREHVANFHMPDFIHEFQFRDSSLPYEPTFTSDAFSPHAYVAQMPDDLAVLSISGWMDGGYMNGSISRFLTHANGRQHLLLGPWDHGARTHVSPFRTREEPSFPVLAEVLRFFDTYLRGDDTGLAGEAPVHYFTMAEERWKAAETWPPADDTFTLYLSDGNGLMPSARPASQDAYAVDYGWGSGANTRYGRLAAQNVREYYPDWHERGAPLLRYESAGLGRDTVVSGHPIVCLHLVTDQPDAAVFVYLEDVAPDGRRRYVTEGVLRALHRKQGTPPASYAVCWPYRSFTRADAEPVPPGEAIELEFALLPTSWRFRAGHRIAIAIAGADWDHYSRLPHGRPGRWHILHGQGQASRLALPVEDIKQAVTDGY